MKQFVKSLGRFVGLRARNAATDHGTGRVKPFSASNANLQSATSGQYGSTPNDRSGSRHQTNSGQAKKSFIVEGWRFLAHSYAMVNQWQLLSLSRRNDVSLKVIDVPLFGRRWQPQERLFDPPAEALLKSLVMAKPDESADITLRVAFPFDFSPSRSRQTAVFATSEFQLIREDQISDAKTYEQLRRKQPPRAIKIVTPSRWSAEGCFNVGFKTDQVLIVPHGVDVKTFHPMPRLRSQIRAKLGLADDDFVFLSVGAMTGNKGIDLLLRAFAEVSRKYPTARLVLKGMDPLYTSKDLLHKSLQTVPAGDQQRVRERLSYFGAAFSNRRMAQFYQIADTYVSAYRAEGFNIPVLEAAASGNPLICTRGGPTDDFVTDAFARKIDSQKVSSPYQDQHSFRLEPNLEHLIGLMSSAIEDDSWRSQAAAAGPSHVKANYTWDHVVDILLEKLKP